MTRLFSVTARLTASFAFVCTFAGVLALAPSSLQSQTAPATPTPAAPEPASPPVPPPGDATTSLVPPADAVALCRDGTFVIAPSTLANCEVRGGLHVALPRRVPPPAPIADAQTRTLDAEADAERVAATPPTGATMRCKDGTWLSGSQLASRCDNAGGVAMLVAVPIALPAPRPEE